MKKILTSLVFMLSGTILLGTLSPVSAVTTSECRDRYPDPQQVNDLNVCLSQAEDTSIEVSEPDGVISNISLLISGAVQLIIVIAGLIAFVYLLLGGIKWITSGGDAGQVEAARNQIIQAIVGIIVVLAAWALIVLVQSLTGACFGIGCEADFGQFFKS